MGPVQIVVALILRFGSSFLRRYWICYGDQKQADLRKVLVVAGQISEYFSFRNAFVASDIEPVLHRDHMGS